MTEEEPLTRDFLLPQARGSEVYFLRQPGGNAHEHEVALNQVRNAGFSEVELHAAIVAALGELAESGELTSAVVAANWTGLIEPALKGVAGSIGGWKPEEGQAETYLPRAAQLVVVINALAVSVPNDITDAIVQNDKSLLAKTANRAIPLRRMFVDELWVAKNQLAEQVEVASSEGIGRLQEVSSAAKVIGALLTGKSPRGGRPSTFAAWRARKIPATSAQALVIQKVFGPSSLIGGAAAKYRTAEEARIALGATLANKPPDTPSEIFDAQVAVVADMSALGWTTAAQLVERLGIPPSKLPLVLTLADRGIASTATAAVLSVVRNPDKPRPDGEGLSRAVVAAVKAAVRDNSEQLGLKPPTFRPKFRRK